MTDKKIKIPVVSARTNNQKEYIKKILENDIIITTGPPGTGKSFIPIGLGICALYTGKIDKLLYTRSMISVGQDIGSLPGTAEEKIDPYLIPFFDEALKLLNKKDFESFRATGQIETCPISLMRGRTIDGWLICSESQNLNKDEIKALLTRIGETGKIILEGDINQCDLENRFKIRSESHIRAGEYYYQVPLEVCINKLKHIPKIAIVQLTDEDIQRNKIISEIETALIGDWGWKPSY